MPTPSDRLRALHQRRSSTLRDYCLDCKVPWPCDTTQVLDELAIARAIEWNLRKENEDLRQELGELDQMYQRMLAIRPSRGQLQAKIKLADALAESMEPLIELAQVFKAELFEDEVAIIEATVTTLRAYKEA